MPSSPGYKRKDGRAGRTIPKRFDYTCVECGIDFVGVKQQRFCSVECKGKHPYSTGKVTTKSQYDGISGNWTKYFGRIINSKASRRENLNPKMMLELLEKQQGKCALSGVELTCQLEVGFKSKTNASIDRLDAGGPYIKDNIQLVCKAVNSFRNNLSVEEYKWWCKQVTDYAK